MKPQHLYILAFKDEPLIKIGISAEPLSRWSQLGESRFDFTRSCLVRAKMPSLIRVLERSLKVAFADHRQDLQTQLPSGNTEVFDQQILSAALQFVESSRASLPHVGLSLQRDLTALVKERSQAATVPAPLAQEAEQARLFEKHRREILQNVAENQTKLAELRRVASSIRVLAARVKHDSANRYEVEMDLELADALPSHWLAQLSRMYTCSAWPRVSKHGKPMYGFSQNGTAYGFAALITCQDVNVETLKLQFDLTMLARVQAKTIEPDPTPQEALAFWKRFFSPTPDTRAEFTDREVAVSQLRTLRQSLRGQAG